MKTLKLTILLLIYIFSSTLLVHAFSMHEVIGDHEVVVDETDHSGCGSMNKSDSSSDRDCIERCLERAQQDSVLSSVEEYCYTVSSHPFLAKNSDVLYCGSPPILFEDVGWLANERFSTLLHTHVTSIRMLD